MSEVKSSGAAIILSFLWTGLGQLYAGKIGRGLAMMVATPFVWSVAFLSGCMGTIWSAGSASSALLASADQPGGGSAGETALFGGLGALGLLGALIPLVWWAWGMVDAKKQCAAFNSLRTDGFGVGSDRK